jgi:hypothetical protein
MSRKSLFFGSIVLLLTTLLIFAGCDNSVSPGAPGPAGTPGAEGPQGNQGEEGDPGIAADAFLPGPTVRASDLDYNYEVMGRDVAVLGTSVTRVTGVIPSGKTLYVLGNVIVGNDVPAITDTLVLEDGAKLIL